MEEISDLPHSQGIDRLRFVLKTDDALASALQQRCSHLFHQQLRAQLASLFVQCEAQSPGAIRIDHLTLDLGQMSEAEFEVQMSQRLLRQLAQQLQAWFSAAPNLAPGETLLVQGEIMSVIADNRADGRLQARVDADAGAQTKGKQDATADVTFAEAVHRNDPIVLLMRYLQTGYLAQPQLWQGQGGADNWLLAQLEQAPSRWQAALARSCLQQGPLQRLQQTFSALTLRLVCRLLTADVPSLPDGLPLPAAVAPGRAADWSLYLALSALLFFQPRAAAPQSAPPHSPAPAEPQDAAMPVLEHWLQSVIAQGRQRLSAMPEQIQVLLDSVVKPPLNDFPGVSASQTAQTKSTPFLDTEPLPVSNAGIVLLWPLLPAWLGRLDLLQKGGDKPGFIDEQAQMQAACWLDSLVWGGDINDITEWRMPLNKLLCGLPLDATLSASPWRVPEMDVIALRDQCLSSLPAQLPGLQRCGVEGVRSLFLQRPGQLLWRTDQAGMAPHWLLQVEQDASDILLRELPWPLEQLMLPWLEQPLPIEWL